MLLIGVDSWWHLTWVCVTSLAAILLFSAATMNWFVTKSRLWESAVLLLACFTLFRPDWWVNQISPPYEERPGSEFLQMVEDAPAGARINFVVEGMDIMGNDVRKTVNVPLGEPGEPLDRLRENGMTVSDLGGAVTISNVAFGSYAKRIGLDIGYEITAVMKRAEQTSLAIPILLAFALAAGVAGLQYVRLRRGGHAPGTGQVKAA
jgi:hypothetical protein